MRDKLIEILYNGFHVSPKDDLNGVVQKAADYLIAHGVTLATDTNVGGKKPLTNGDRIRAMSDEELAELLNRVQRPCNFCQLAIWEGACTETLCDDAMMNWLKQPVKEEA